MKMIFLWAFITFMFAFKAKELNRWTVGAYAVLCLANTVFAYLTF